MRILAAAVSLAAAALLAAAPRGTAARDATSASSPDGGTRTRKRAEKPKAPRKAAAQASDKPVILGDPPGTLHNWREAQKDGPDAGVPAHDQSATVKELQKEIADLRARTATLEKQATATQQQTELLQQMSQQLADLRGQMANVDDRREAAQQQGAQARQASESAIAGLVSAQNVLAGGNSDIGDALDAADQSLSPQARRDVGAARAAIQNRDLSAARSYLQAAISAAQAGR